MDFIARRSLVAAGRAERLPRASSMPGAPINARHGTAQQLAPDQLHAAETSLKTAERTYEDEGDTPAMRDHAHVAMRKAQLAEAQAGIVQANMQYQRAESRLAADKRAGATVTSELEAVHSELQQVAGIAAAQSEELQAETERRRQAEAAQQQALAALESAGEVKREPRGTVITLSGSVICPSGQSMLLPSARNKLSEVAKWRCRAGRATRRSWWRVIPTRPAPRR